MRQLEQPIELKDNFVPVLSLRRKMAHFVDKFHLSDPQRGSDDLDDYEAVLLETDGERFLLLRYARYPEDMVDVFIPARKKGSALFIQHIVKELDIPRDAIIRHH
jgi:hypothetical protein